MEKRDKTIEKALEGGRKINEQDEYSKGSSSTDSEMAKNNGPIPERTLGEMSIYA